MFIYKICKIETILGDGVICLNHGLVHYPILFLIVGLKVIGFCLGVIFLGSALLNVHYIRSIPDSYEKHDSVINRKGRISRLIMPEIKYLELRGELFHCNCLNG